MDSTAAEVPNAINDDLFKSQAITSQPVAEVANSEDSTSELESEDSISELESEDSTSELESEDSTSELESDDSTPLLEAPQLEAPQLEAEGTPQLEAEGTPQLEAEGTPQLEAEGTPQLEALQLEAEGTPQLEAPQLEAEGTPQLEAPQLEAEGTQQLETGLPMGEYSEYQVINSTSQLGAEGAENKDSTTQLEAEEAENEDSTSQLGAERSGFPNRGDPHMDAEGMRLLKGSDNEHDDVDLSPNDPTPPSEHDEDNIDLSPNDPTPPDMASFSFLINTHHYVWHYYLLWVFVVFAIMCLKGTLESNSKLESDFLKRLTDLESHSEQHLKRLIHLENEKRLFDKHLGERLTDLESHFEELNKANYLDIHSLRENLSDKVKDFKTETLWSKDLAMLLNQQKMLQEKIDEVIKDVSELKSTYTKKIEDKIWDVYSKINDTYDWVYSKTGFH